MTLFITVLMKLLYYLISIIAQFVFPRWVAKPCPVLFTDWIFQGGQNGTMPIRVGIWGTMHFSFPVIPYMAYCSIMSNMCIQMYVYVVSILVPTLLQYVTWHMRYWWYGVLVCMGFFASRNDTLPLMLLSYV